LRILVVDNSKTMRYFIKDIIKHWFADKMELNSLEIEETYNGHLAFEKVSNEKFDMVFISMIIKGKDGIEFLRSVRELQSTQKPHITVHTSLASPNIENLVLSLGANSYLKKPLSIEGMEAILDEYLSTSSKENENSFYDFDKDDIAPEFDMSGGFEEFMDFDEMDNLDQGDCVQSEHLQHMDSFNQSHHNISAKEFLNELDIKTLDMLVSSLGSIEKEMKILLLRINEKNILGMVKDVVFAVKKLIVALKNVDRFSELITSLKIFNEILSQLQKDKEIQVKLTKDTNKRIIMFIAAIIEDILDWKNHVFISQSAADVFYINASSLNSCVEFEHFIKNKLR